MLLYVCSVTHMHSLFRSNGRGNMHDNGALITSSCVKTVRRKINSLWKRCSYCVNRWGLEIGEYWVKEKEGER